MLQYVIKREEHICCHCSLNEIEDENQFFLYCPLIGLNLE